MPGGRPTDYTKELATLICEMIMEGMSVREIGRLEEMPHSNTIFVWLGNHKEFQGQYARAKEVQIEKMGEEIIEIADDGSNDYIERKRQDDSKYTEFDKEHVQRSRLRIDARKWLMGKLKPKKYGNKVQHTGPDGEEPVKTENTFNFIPVGNKK